MGQSRCGRGYSARHAAHGTRKHQGSYRCDAQGWVPRHTDYPLAHRRGMELAEPSDAQVLMRSAHHGRLFGMCPQAVARHLSITGVGGDGCGVGVLVAVPAAGGVIAVDGDFVSPSTWIPIPIRNPPANATLPSSPTGPFARFPRKSALRSPLGGRTLSARGQSGGSARCARSSDHRCLHQCGSGEPEAQDHRRHHRGPGLERDPHGDGCIS
jgi:hypothetical protein